jgi:uncharacterized Fe-S cluster-containing radical SAM superfamily protein
MNKGEKYQPQRITCGFVGLELVKIVGANKVVTKKHIGEALARLNMGSESSARNYTNVLRANGVIDGDGTLDFDAVRSKTIEVSVPGMYVDEVESRIKEITYRYGNLSRINIVE